MATRRSKAIYPGTFDPITNGHMSLVGRACHLFDELVVAVSRNAGKSPFFSFDERFRLVEKSVQRQAYAKKVEVVSFDGLLADLALQLKANAIIRGLRAVSDFEYEFQMALMNRKLARRVETVFLMPSEKYIYLHSSLVKEIYRLGGDISCLVPPAVVKRLDEWKPLQGG